MLEKVLYLLSVNTKSCASEPLVFHKDIKANIGIMKFTETQQILNFDNVWLGR